MDINELFDNTKNWANLENKFVKILKSFWWTIKENIPYLDPVTDKQRELDILAIKTYLVWENNHWINKPELLEMRLFIDCKNLPNGLGLYVHNVDKENLYEAFLNKPIYSRLYDNYFQMNQDLPSIVKEHRFFTKKKIVYKSSNNDDRSIWIQWTNQILHAMHSTFYSSSAYWNIDYPIIAVNKLTDIAIESEEDGSREFASDNMLYWINYIVKPNKKHYIVDIVGLDKLEQFLEWLDKEFEWLKNPIFQDISRKSFE